MRYQSTPEKEFDGDIIITDPCYIIRNENGITKNDWHYCEYGEYMERLGIKNYLTHDTIYGDWGCTVFDSDTKKPLGRFCADAGLVSVFLLHEVLAYNPNFNYHLERPWTATIIPDFKGTIQIEVVKETGTHEKDSEYWKAGETWEDYLVHVVGHGVNKKTGKAINFISKQTSLWDGVSWRILKSKPPRFRLRKTERSHRLTQRKQLLKQKQKQRHCVLLRRQKLTQTARLRLHLPMS